MSKRYKFPAIFEYAEDGITVTIPDLAGCISCGKTTDETMQMAQEALSLYLEDMTEDNIPMPNELSAEFLKPSKQIFMIEIIQD